MRHLHPRDNCITPSTIIFSLLLLGTPQIRLTAAEVTCFAPDGVTVADNETYVPCNKLGITQQGVHSSCCKLDGPADDRDLCASTGLCINNGVVNRGYCTDRTWQSPACVNVCAEPKVFFFSLTVFFASYFCYHVGFPSQIQKILSGYPSPPSDYLSSQLIESLEQKYKIAKLTNG